MNKFTKITLNDGSLMPVIGLGTVHLMSAEGKQAMLAALESGYRMIDTAQSYDNEETVGEAVRESKIPRQDVFITTKIHDENQGYTSTMDSFYDSLKRLQMDYVDLLLVHWPNVDNFERSLDTWQALIDLRGQDKAKSIGVSNYTRDFIQTTINHSGVTPSVNQVEFSPFLYQAELMKYCKSKGIKIQAYSPIVRAKRDDNPLLQTLAEKYHKSPVQVILRWHIEHGVVPIPRSLNPAHIKNNIDIFDFSLSEDEVKAIDDLDEGLRLVHPEKAPEEW